MKSLILLLGVFSVVTVLAEAPPKWNQMQRAILVEPDMARIKELVESGFDLNSPIGCGAFAALDGAIGQQNPELVDMLVSLGAEPTETQMVAAAFCSNHQNALKIVKALLEAGVSVNAKDFYDKTRFSMPLHQAVWRENKELIAYLLEQDGIRLEDTNVDGYTPLMIAVEHGREDIIDMLLAAGANPTTKNKNGVDAAAISSAEIMLQKRIQERIGQSKEKKMQTPTKQAD